VVPAIPSHRWRRGCSYMLRLEARGCKEQCRREKGEGTKEFHKVDITPETEGSQRLYVNPVSDAKGHMEILLPSEKHVASVNCDFLAPFFIQNERLRPSGGWELRM
jgi:hypothetical protein